MKDMINKLNFIASLGFGAIGLYFIVNGQFSTGFEYLGLSVFLLLTVMVYSLFLHMKRQAHKVVSVIIHVSKALSKKDEDYIHKNKIMNVVFLIDCLMFKKEHKTLTGSSWAWQNHNPVNPIISSFFSTVIPESSVEYELTEEEKALVSEVLFKVENLSKIEVDNYMFSLYPSLLKLESKENHLIKFETI
jgi:hypothetical protein